MIEQFWLFHCGYSRIPASLITRDAGFGLIRLPYLCALLVHSEHGLILIDAPFGREGAANVGPVFGTLMRTLGFRFKREWSVVERVRECGFRASEVRHVLMTHLHFDHTGGMKNVAHAKFHVSESEWDFATNRGSLTTAYVLNDYRALQDVVPFDDQPCDLFGDGSVETIPTPGHTVGHTSYKLTLGSGDQILFLGDASFTVDQVARFREFGTFPKKAAFDSAAAERTLQTLRTAHVEGQTVITSHDPDWGERCRFAPLPLHAATA